MFDLGFRWRRVLVRASIMAVAMWLGMIVGVVLTPVVASHVAFTRVIGY